MIAEPAHFIDGNPPFLFVDISHPTIEDPRTRELPSVSLNFHDIQRSVQIGSVT
ncbi:unnamed protein product, partial [Didymodactylos carnosus]